MFDVIMENLVEIAATLIITAIGIAGTWLTAKIGKRQEPAAINAAQAEVVGLAQQTVGELQQTIVEGLKAAHADGKLTQEEIEGLKDQVLDLTMKKLSLAANRLLEAASVDVAALIRGASEDWISKLKCDF